MYKHSPVLFCCALFDAAKIISSITFLTLACAVHGLQPLDDNELAATTGQAFIQIDRSTQGAVDFSRFTMGMEMDVSLNADLVDIGRYDRAGEIAGSSDIRFNDFALGAVNEDGTLDPFYLADPFIELAFEDINGRQDLVGARIGFGEAFGKLTGNIETLTGNIEVALYGTGEYLETQISCGFLDLICAAAKGLVGSAYANDEFAADAVLVSYPNGNPDPIRARYIGLTDGQTLSIPAGSGFDNFLLGIFSSNNCSLLGAQTCFPLSNYRTLEVGNTETGAPAEGLFLSFQTKDLTWFDNGTPTTATAGAFLNIPNGGIRTSFPEAFEGIARTQTKFLDPYHP